MRTLTIISVILFTNLFSDLSAGAGEIRLQEDAPEHYSVVPGDTLWGIASRFLKDPWRWPDIWQMNREQIKNPHRIYPGDVIVMEHTDRGKRLRIDSRKATVKLSPQIRSEALSMRAIPSIPVDKIEPFLSQPLVIEKNQLEEAPVILGSSDDRVILSTGDTVYVRDLPADRGKSWQIFRSGKALIDPDQDDRILGYEAVYLGNVEVVDFAGISTVKVAHSVREVLKGDRLVPASVTAISDYLPHAPDFPVTGRIISVYDGVNEIGENAIVTLNKGIDDGIEVGHVLAIYRKSEIRSHEGKRVNLPDERIGLVFVFRIFDKVSYALVMQSVQAIKVTDAVKTP
jgi:hypothetical protein